MMSDKDNFDDGFDDLGNDGFDDFDANNAAADGKLTANPFVKLGGALLVVVLLVGAIFYFNRSTETDQSRMGSVDGGKEVAGTADVSPDMKERLEQTNKMKEDIAKSSGESFIPVPTEGPQQNTDIFNQNVEDTDLADPLEQWRNRRTTRNRATPEPLEVQPIEIQPEQIAVQPNPEAVTNLGGAMATQMQAILGQKQPRGINLRNVGGMGETLNSEVFYANTKYSKPPNLETAAVNTEAGAEGEGEGLEEITAETLMSAGTVVYAQTLTEANTDAPGPVLAQILSGPLKGSRIIGDFSNTRDFLILNFSQVVVDGESLPIDAVALDVDTTLTGVVTDKDNRYFSRIVLPAAAAFIEGFGSAVAESGSTTVTVEGETVTEETEDLDTREELFKGLEEASSVVAGILDEEGSAVQPMIKVAAGTPIGILFVSPVIRGLDTEEEE